MIGCQFCGAAAKVGVQVDPRDPKDVRPACQGCGEKIKALAGSYKLVALDKARPVVSEPDEPDPED